MIPVVHIRSDEGSGFRVGSSNNEVRDTHDVVLKPDRDESVDVLGDGDENLSGHVSALLGTRRLILNMDTYMTIR